MPFSLLRVHGCTDASTHILIALYSLLTGSLLVLSNVFVDIWSPANCNMRRKLYKQSLHFRLRMRLEILKAVSSPISVHASLFSLSKDSKTVSCLDRLLKWVIMIEGTSRIGISGNVEDKVRACSGLLNLILGGSRMRLRNPKRGKTGFGSEQAERGLETVRKVVESYFVDDMCHLFERVPRGELYERVQHIDEDIAVGIETIQGLSAAAEKSMFTRHIAVIPLMGFVMYICEQIVNAISGAGEFVDGHFEIWRSNTVLGSVRLFCRDVCRFCCDTLGPFPGVSSLDSGAIFSTLSKMSEEQLNKYSILHSANVLSCIVSVLANAVPVGEVTDNLLSAMRSCLFAERQKAARSPEGSLKQIKSVIRRYVSTCGNRQFAVPVRHVQRLHDLGKYFRELVEPVTSRNHGIVGHTGFLHRKLKRKDLLEFTKPYMKLEPSFQCIRSDISKLHDAKSYLPFFPTEYRDETNCNGVIPATDGVSVQFPAHDELVSFMERCLLQAVSLAEEFVELKRRNELSSFEELRSDTIRMIILGCIGSDLEGILTAWYEDYAFKEILSGFEEGTGMRGTRTSKTAGRRERSPKGTDRRTKKARLLKEEKTAGEEGDFVNEDGTDKELST